MNLVMCWGLMMNRNWREMLEMNPDIYTPSHLFVCM